MTGLNDIYRGDTRLIKLVIRKEGATLSAKLSTAISGAITAVVATVTYTPSTTPAKTGHLEITNAHNQTQTIAYSDWSANGNTYTFTVSATMDFTYDAESTTVEIDSRRVDITGATITFTMTKNPTLTATLSKNATLPNPTAGEALITLESIDTEVAVGAYYYDIQMTTATGEVSTLIKSTINILQEVTQ